MNLKDQERPPRETDLPEREAVSGPSRSPLWGSEAAVVKQGLQPESDRKCGFSHRWYFTIFEALLSFH